MSDADLPGSGNASRVGSLKRVGLKATMPRTHILRILEQKGRHKHLSAVGVHQELLKKGEKVGIATIYRVLTQFEAAGLVIRQRFGARQALFELDDGAHHDHMICMDTGTVVEFQNELIEKLLLETAARHGYDLVDHSLVLHVRPRKQRPRD